MKNNKLSIVGITKIALVAAIYVALTLVFQGLSFATIQLRISEILLFFVFFDKKYSIGILIGTIIANFFSPLGITDVLFGGFATALVLFLMMFIPNPKKILSLLWAPVVNGAVVAFEIKFISLGQNVVATTQSYWWVAFSVFAGEFIVIVFGYIIYLVLNSNKNVAKFLMIDQPKKAAEE